MYLPMSALGGSADAESLGVAVAESVGVAVGDGLAATAGSAIVSAAADVAQKEAATTVSDTRAAEMPFIALRVIPLPVLTG